MGLGSGISTGCAVGEDSEIGGPVAHEDEHDGDDGERGDGDGDRDRAPAGCAHDPAVEGQEDELTSGAGGGENADDQSFAGNEPAAGNGGGEDSGHRAGTEADHDAPGQVELPGLMHPGGEGCSSRDKEEGTGDDAADAEAFHHGGGEGTHETEEEQVDRDRDRDGGAGPAELILERNDEDRRCRTEGGGAEQNDEGCPEHDPGVVEVAQSRDHCVRVPGSWCLVDSNFQVVEGLQEGLELGLDYGSLGWAEGGGD